MADRSDITEELVRLHSHFDQLEQLLDSDAPVGRRLDFLLQEIGREANTTGAKSQDAPLAQLATINIPRYHTESIKGNCSMLANLT